MKFGRFKCAFVIVFFVCTWNIKQSYLLPRLSERSPVTNAQKLVNEISNYLQSGSPFPVDVVYAWVNGSDPWFLNELERLKNDLRETKSFSATKARNLANNRFADYGGLRFSLRSLEKYANWIRHVFIVTNGHIPNWLNTSNARVTIVSHKEIIDESVLPTFSSRVIGHNIHKIRGLSERFIYMNDDYFFGKKVSLEDFYTEEKGTKVYLAWIVSTNCSAKCNVKMVRNGICDDVCNYDHCAWDGGDCDDIPVQQRPKDNDKSHCDYAVAIFYTNAIYNRAFGYKQRRVISHSPLFMEKGVKHDLNKRFANEINETNHHKLRSPLDIHFEFSYMHFLMEAYKNSKRFETKVNSPDIAFVTINTNLANTRKNIGYLKKTKRKFICINDDIDYSDRSQAKKSIGYVEEYYKSMFPDPSSFEKRT